MRPSDPTPLLLLAREDRASLLRAIDELLQLAPERLAAAVLANIGGGAERLAIIAPPEKLAARLALARERIGASPGPARLLLRRHGIFFASGAQPGKIALLFPGQGSQHPGMLAQLRHRVPRVGVWFDVLDEVYREAGCAPPSALLSASGQPAISARQASADLLELQRGGPLGIIAGLALFELVRDLGVRADCMLGHSNGEHAAVCAAGRVPMDDPRFLALGLLSVTLAAERLPAPPVPEQMLALGNLEPTRLARLLGDRVDCWLAMDNCPQQQVIAGTATACAALRPALVGANALISELPFSRAYHTPLFADWYALLADYYEQLPLSPGRCPVVSCHDRRPLPIAADACRRAMLAQWMAPVRFRETILDLYRDGVRTFVEVGPDQKLSAFVDDILRGRAHLAVATSSTRLGELEQIQMLLAELFVHGVSVTANRLAPLLGALDSVSARLAVAPTPASAPASASASGVIDRLARVHRGLIARTHAGHDRLRMQWPTALASRRGPATLGGPALAALPLLGAQVSIQGGMLSARLRLTRRTDPFVDDHALGRVSACTSTDAFPLPVLAFTAALAIAAQAAAQLSAQVRELQQVRALRWLALDQGVLDLDIAARRAASGVEVRLSALGEPDAFTAVVGTTPSMPTPVVVAPLAGRPPIRWSIARFYARYAFHGPSFQGLVQVLAVGADGIAAELRTTELPGMQSAALPLDPALLDCAGQLVAFWLLEHGRRPPSFGLFPVAAERVLLHGPPPAPGQRCLCRVAIRLDEAGFTSADVHIETAVGEAIASIVGLRQRLIEVPDWLARSVFGGAPVRLPEEQSVPRALLLEQGRIWQRVLAHLTLSASELRVWGQYRASAQAADWLLRRLSQRRTIAVAPPHSPAAAQVPDPEPTLCNS